MFKRRSFPRRGELVIGEVTRIDEYGAYIHISEYEKEGFIPRSEVSSKWVKDIRHFVRENQRVVARVIRVNPRREIIDLSLKSVREGEAKKALQEWKRRKRAVYLLNLLSKRLKRSLEDIYKRVGTRFEREFGDALAGFEMVVYEGPEFLDKMGFTDEEKGAIREIAERNIEVPIVTMSRYVKLVSLAPDGVKAIRDVLVGAREENKENGFEIKITSAGSPRYRITVISDDAKRVDRKLRDIIRHMQEAAQRKPGMNIEILEKKEVRKGG